MAFFPPAAAPFGAKGMPIFRPSLKFKTSKQKYLLAKTLSP